MDLRLLFLIFDKSKEFQRFLLIIDNQKFKILYSIHY